MITLSFQELEERTAYQIKAKVLFFGLYFEVYPKVKVREQEQDNQYAVSTPKKTSCSPVKEHENDSMVFNPRIPGSNKSSSVVPMISVPKGNEDQKVVQNVRARSILQPRAVLSSPDNDRIIGKRNRMGTQQSSPPKNQNLVQSRHALCKIVPSPVGSCTPRKVVATSPRNTKRKIKEETGDSNKDPVKTRKSSKEVSDRKSDPKVKKEPAVAAPCRKLNWVTGRSSSL